MYRFWTPVIEPLLESLEPNVIVEIGSDQGFNTRNLVEFAQRNDSIVHVIDPLPKYDVDEWLGQYSPNLVFHRDLSLGVLGDIEEPEVVLIDGDHNWHTVLGELRILEAAAKGGPEYPLVLLHDVGWPYGRRDLYYEPEQIPQPDRQPHAKGGLRPGRTDLDPNGGLNTHLFSALQEGGPRNGVLTAVEDFIAESARDLELVIVPGINGLGVLYPSSLLSNDRATGIIEQLRQSQPLREVLTRVESLRIESQIDMLDLQKDRDQKRRLLAEQSSKEADLQAHLKASQGEIIRSRQSLTESEEARKRLAEEMAEVSSALDEEKQKRHSVRAELASARKKLAQSEYAYKRLSSRRSVRLALAIASLARPLIRGVRRFKKGRRRPALSEGTASSTSTAGTMALSGRKRSGPTTRDQARLVKAVVRDRPGSDITTGPFVSLIVLTRNGARHLQRLLPALDSVTTYRSFELIVVDNGSSDNSSEILSLKRGYPVRVIRNESNKSFSEGNNQAAAVAQGEFLLFLNNDIEPINPGWLGSLVDAITTEGVVAVGAELVYPVRGIAEKDLTVQHMGIGFEFRNGAVRAVNLAAEEPLDPSLEGTRRVPAATAAALLVEADVFQSVGGFDEGYVYGTEDVDLCLKLRERGHIAVTGQAVLFHHESATQHEAAEAITRMNRVRNHRRFAEHWGPRLTRSLLLERLSGREELQVPHKRTVAITLTHDDASRGWGDYYTAHGLGKAFEVADWQVIYAERHEEAWYDIDSEVDLVISLLDSFDIRKAPDGAFTVAWVRNWVDRWLEQPWFDSYDMVVTSSHKASALVAERSRFVPPVIPMATDSEQFAPGPENPTFRSDYVFTGNNWGHGRSIVDLLDIHPNEEFLVFGKGWDRDPRMHRYWRGHLDHELLPEVYRSAKIVLDDTATPTLPYAFVNGRVLDALATGAVVVTDNLEGSHELFDGLLPTYAGREELRTQIDYYLANDSERQQLADELRKRVLADHTYSRRPGDFLAAAIEHLNRPRAAIKIAVPSEGVQESWGDTHFARGLAAALGSLGMPTEVHILPEWDSPANQAVDVVIHLRGLANYVPKPAHINVLWIISHPNEVSLRECEKYDLVLVASSSHAEWLRSQVDKPVVYMPQATDSRRFAPREEDDDLASEVLFLGNSRSQDRPAVSWAIERGLPLTIYGSGWDKRVPRRFLKADHFPNEDLASLYSSAKVVLNDHWPDMRDRGFISNRVFDALASGAVVVSDRAHGLEEIFGSLVPTYSNPEELEETVHKLLADEQLLSKLASEGAELIADQHTFGHRAERLVELLEPQLKLLPRDLEGNLLAIQPGLNVARRP